MIEPSGPLVVFGVKSFPDSRDVLGEDAVLVPMTSRLSVVPLPSSAVLFTPTHFITSDVQLRLQDELDTLWRSVECQFEGSAALNHEYEFVVVFSNMLLWRWLIRHTIKTLKPIRILVPSRCVENNRTVTSRDEILEWVLYRVLEEETRQVERGYFTEVDSSIFAQSETRSLALFAQKFAGFTARVIKQARKFFLVRTLPLGSADLSGKVSYRGRAFGALHERHSNQVQNVLVIAQLGKVRSILESRSTGIRIGYLSYDQFEELVSPADGYKPRETALSPALSAQSALLAYFRSLVERSEISQEPIERLLRGNWSILVTDAEHHPQIRALMERCIQVGKRVATVPEGAISYVGYMERFGGSLNYDNSHVTRFVLDEAKREYWIRAGTPASRIHVSGYLGSDRPSAGRRRSVESFLLDSCIQGLPTGERDVTVMLSFDGFFWLHEIVRFGSPCISLITNQLLQIVDELLELGYLVLAKTRDPEVTRYLQSRYAGRSAMFTHSIPWEILADRSDIVMTRDSSIGWQSLSGGKPVLLWNFEDYPGFAEVTLDGIPNHWVSVVQAIDDLDESITALIARHREESLRSGVDGRLLPPVVSRPGVIRDWINNSTPA